MNDIVATADEDILFAQRCWIGHVTLNRPRTFNALTWDMCRRFDRQMQIWAKVDEIAGVVVTGAGDRAFCAGGDVRAIALLGKNSKLSRDFFWDEYRLNRRLYRYAKPYVAIADGITMGGGVGVSAPAKYRVVTEKTLFAMPETAIGLFPDVGGTYYLSRCPGETGVYLALTGERIKAADLIYTGLYTHYVRSEAVPELLTNIENEAVSRVFARTAEATPEKPMMAQRRKIIDRCFAGDSIEAIRDALSREQSDWARETLAKIDKTSPLSLRITLRALREGAEKSFEDCMKTEYRLVRRFMQGHDFFEGVRAALIDKDNQPRWSPATLADVTPEIVDAYFAPLTDEDELHFDD